MKSRIPSRAKHGKYKMLSFHDKEKMIRELEEDASHFAEMASRQTSERLRKQYEAMAATYRARADELSRQK